ncbi:MAG: DUF4405 domain-containing protein [Patescibacteria group bacterium]|nr:DUF4405 domain-containing protein [Patescibacteria group bacterium]
MDRISKTLALFCLLFFIPGISLAWNNCPYNETDCPSPGECSRYTDTNNDNICDYSQPEPPNKNSLAVNSEVTSVASTETEDIHDLISGKELKTKTVSEIAEIYQIDPKEFAKKLAELLKVKLTTTHSFQFLHDEYDLEPSVAKDIAVGIKTQTLVNVSEINSQTNNKKSERTYHALPITLFLIVLYSISFILLKKKIISLATHKKIWNIFLLITFLISGVSGMLLIVKLNTNIVIPWPFSLLLWHVETGIAMFIISLFHIIERRSYFKNIFSRKK